MLTLFLVDDHAIVRAGIKNLLESQDDMAVVGEAATMEEALPLVRARKPQMVLLDLELPGRDGGEAVGELFAAVPGMRVVVVSHRLDPWEVRRLCDIGIAGYVHKSSPPSELVRVVRQAGEGRVTFCPESTRALLDMVRSPCSTAPLSPRQVEILSCVAEGLTTGEIARRLCLSPKTVEKHRGRILRALGARNAVEAVESARRLKLLRAPPGEG